MKKWIIRLAVITALIAGPALAVGELAVSVRPMLRPVDSAPGGATQIASEAGFQDWVRTFRQTAVAQGISGAIYDRAFKGVVYDAKVVRRDRNQSEFTKTIWDYLDTAVSDARVRNGKAAVARQAAALRDIEAQYGVRKEIVAAIWGLESAYGAFRGSDNTMQSLATLAYDGRRAEFFEAQVLAALRILQEGDVTAPSLRGSWAGAMGHTQFMPTSFQDHAVDYDGDGKRDIWSDDPRDALASTAAYLKFHGWQSGVPWGVEVRLPDGFDHRVADRKIRKMPSAWAAMGVVGMHGEVDDHGPASLLLPGGHTGAAFLIFDNFEVLEAYNTADAYVIGVGHLADRIAGGPAIVSGWPRQDRVLSYDERIELQERLTAAGFDTVKIDAKIGPLTVDAVRAYQVSQGLVPDGYANLGLLERLRKR